MPKRSAGLLMYRRLNAALEVFLVHPGGPYWARKDLGAWTIPKGEFRETEEPFEAAKREFEEETGFKADGNFIDLGERKQPGGKTVLAWAFEGDCDPQNLKSNLCAIEWPPRSGHIIQIPEVDSGAWYQLGDAKARLLPGQREFLDRLVAIIGD